jgi:MazG family protein
VLKTVNTKIVYRHPHVFGDVKVDGVENVLENWERLKAAERQANGKEESSSLDGIASALPALVQADQYQDRAARFGFEWPDFARTIAKVREEINEVEAETDEAYRWEVGDLLFAVVNLARKLHVDAEPARSQWTFRQRFTFMKLLLANRQELSILH